MTVSVIIVNWNSKAYVRECLRSLYAHCRSVDYEVIVVDGGSFDGCDQMLAEEFPTAKYVQSRDNIGFGMANNLGVEHSTGRHLLLLNPDTLLIEDSIMVLLQTIKALPRPGAVGCKLLNADRTIQTSCIQSYPTVLNQVLDSEFLRLRYPLWRLWGTASLHLPSVHPSKVEAVSGACIMVARDAFEAVGGFTRSFFMYGEDLDLCFKLQRAGFTNYYVPATRLVHLGGGSSRQAASSFSTLMMHHSVCHFMWLNRGPMQALAYRGAMAISAFIRLLLIAPLMAFGDRIVRHGTDSWRKWLTIFLWSIRLRRAPARPRSIEEHSHGAVATKAPAAPGSDR